MGTIKFTLSYDFGSQTLLVKIIKADGLPAMDIGGTSDPFVKVSSQPAVILNELASVGMFAARQKEQAWDESKTENAKPYLEWDARLSK